MQHLSHPGTSPHHLLPYPCAHPGAAAPLLLPLPVPPDLPHPAQAIPRLIPTLFAPTPRFGPALPTAGPSWGLDGAGALSLALLARRVARFFPNNLPPLLDVSGET